MRAIIPQTVWTYQRHCAPAKLIGCFFFLAFLMDERFHPQADSQSHSHCVHDTFSGVLWPDLTAQGDIWKDVGICIDPVQGVHHGLHSLDPILLSHRAALPLVDLDKRQQTEWIGHSLSQEQQLQKIAATCTTTTLSAGGWWWTENRAPMMMSPGMCANTLLSVFWALTPAWCLRPCRPRSATRKTVSASRLTQSPGVNPILLTLLPLLTPSRRLCPLKVEG